MIMTEEEAKQYAMNADHFYRGMVWGMLDERLRAIEENVKQHNIDDKTAHEGIEQRLDKLNGKMIYIYAFSAGVTICISVFWQLYQFLSKSS